HVLHVAVSPRFLQLVARHHQAKLHPGHVCLSCASLLLDAVHGDDCSMALDQAAKRASHPELMGVIHSFAQRYFTFFVGAWCDARGRSTTPPQEMEKYLAAAGKSSRQQKQISQKDAAHCRASQS